jgi:hypothetical protein
MKYDIVRTETLTALEKQVERRCREGWRPTGGPVALDYRMGTATTFMQAMIYDPEFQKATEGEKVMEKLICED